MLWLDCDREGENIAFEVIDVCKQSNSRIEIYRAHFSALIPRYHIHVLWYHHNQSPSDIHNVCRTLTPPDHLASEAVDARQELDLRIGAAFTRFQTMRLQKKFQGLQDQVISYGSFKFRGYCNWPCQLLRPLPIPYPGLCSWEVLGDREFCPRRLLDNQSHHNKRFSSHTLCNTPILINCVSHRWYQL